MAKNFRSGQLKGEAEGLAEGKVEGQRDALIRLAVDRLGTPPESALKRLKSINHAEELSPVTLRLLHVSSWEALLEG